MKKGQEVELLVTKLVFGGRGLARLDDFVVFVDKALPGQTVKARITRKRKSYAEARTLEVLSPSPHQVDPVCRHFGSCGGCQFQHLDYEQQLAAKSEQVCEAFKHIGHLQSIQMEPILPSPALYYYRNKMEFSFSRERWLSQEEINSGEEFEKTGMFLGLHARGFYDKVVDLQECHLLHPIAAQLVHETREFAQQTGLPCYSTRDHTGFFRFLIIRKSTFTEDLMVNLVTSEYNHSVAQHYRNHMIQQIPQITSLLTSTTQTKSSVAFGEQEFVLAGNRTIFEQLGPRQFEISSNSFFQTNSRQAVQLYDLVLEYANLKGTEQVYDLYCGAGTISLYICDQARHVVGFEAVESAIDDAHRNALHNGVENCDFVPGDLKYLRDLAAPFMDRHGKPDVMIIDPPRAGMHPDTVRDIPELDPRRIVHVSCNPATLARDLELLCENGYHLIKARPVDMFPHTSHIEVIALLERKGH